MKEQIGA